MKRIRLHRGPYGNLWALSALFLAYQTHADTCNQLKQEIALYQSENNQQELKAAQAKYNYQCLPLPPLGPRPVRAIATQSEQLLNPRSVSWGPGRIDVVAVGASSRKLYHKAWTQLADSGNAWEPLGGDVADAGGDVADAAVIASWGPNHLDVFEISTDHQMYHKAWDPQTRWPASWEPLGGSFAGAPAVVSSGSQQLDIFAVGTDGRLYHKAWVQGQWMPGGTATAPWENLGVVAPYVFAAGSPAAVSWGAGRVDVFVTGTDGSIYHKGGNYQGGTGITWFPAVPGQFEPLGGSGAGSPSASSWGSGRIDIVYVGKDHAVWHKAWDQGAWAPGGVSNGPWDPLAGRALGVAVASSWGSNRFDVTVINVDDGTVNHKAWDPTNRWQPDGMSGRWDKLGGRTFGMPTVPSWAPAGSWGPGRYDVFVTGADDGAVYHKFGSGGNWFSNSDPNSWDRQASAPTPTPGTAPYYVLACKFADHPEDWSSLSYFSQLFTNIGSGKGNLLDYWGAMSQGAVDLSGSKITSGWATLPKTFPSYYGRIMNPKYVQEPSANSHLCDPNAPKPNLQIVDDCIAASGVQNSLDPYYGVIVVMNYGEFFQGYVVPRDTGSGPRPFGEIIYGPGTLPCKNKPSVYFQSTPSWWPPMACQNSAHEMGHSLGLSHAHSLHLDGSFDEYGDGWDIMGYGQGFPSTSFLKAGPGLNGPHRQQLGWIATARVNTYLGGAVQVALTALNHPENAGFQMARVLINDDAQHYYTVELRTPTDWDQGLGSPPGFPPSEAIVIHEVRLGTESLLRLKDPLHGQFVAGDTFVGDGGIQIRVNSISGSTAALLQASITISRN